MTVVGLMVFIDSRERTKIRSGVRELRRQRLGQENRHPESLHNQEESACEIAMRDNFQQVRESYFASKRVVKVTCIY
jgi:hypothetical protein